MEMQEPSRMTGGSEQEVAATAGFETDPHSPPQSQLTLRARSGRAQSSRMLTRRFWRPLFSILPSRRLPISPVRATWVPPQGCRST